MGTYLAFLLLINSYHAWNSYGIDVIMIMIMILIMMVYSGGGQRPGWRLAAVGDKGWMLL